MENYMKGYVKILRNDICTEAAQIARVCTGREDNHKGLFKTVERLVRDRHWSVFEHLHVQFEIYAPIYVMRQWMRHSGAWMERSLRYTREPVIGPQSEAVQPYLLGDYNALLSVGYAPEDARKILPLDTMTKCIWTVNLRDYLHFLRLRLDSHTQKETRAFAIATAQLFGRVNKELLEYFFNYDFLSLTLPYDETISPEKFMEVTIDGQTEFRHRTGTVETIMEGVENGPTYRREVELSPSNR